MSVSGPLSTIHRIDIRRRGVPTCRYRRNPHNGVMDAPDERFRTSAWRDPLSMGWSAHRQLLMMRLRWHERRDAAPTRRRPLSQLTQRLHAARRTQRGDMPAAR
jgi:hypothetical protein